MIVNNVRDAVTAFDGVILLRLPNTESEILSAVDEVIFDCPTLQRNGKLMLLAKTLIMYKNSMNSLRTRCP